MGGDTAIAPADDRMRAVVAAACIAARCRRALVAGRGDIVEIGAARALHQIAADRRCIPQLRRRSGQKRFGDGREAPREIAVVSYLGIADQRANAHSAAR